MNTSFLSFLHINNIRNFNICNWFSKIKTYIIETWTSYQSVKSNVIGGNKINHKNCLQCDNVKQNGEYFCSNHLHKTLDIEIYECPVCFELRHILPYSCGHLVCMKCTVKFSNKICPLCRHQLPF